MSDKKKYVNVFFRWTKQKLLVPVFNKKLLSNIKVYIKWSKFKCMKSLLKKKNQKTGLNCYCARKIMIGLKKLTKDFVFSMHY